MMRSFSVGAVVSAATAPDGESCAPWLSLKAAESPRGNPEVMRANSELRCAVSKAPVKWQIANRERWQRQRRVARLTDHGAQIRHQRAKSVESRATSCPVKPSRSNRGDALSGLSLLVKSAHDSNDLTIEVQPWKDFEEVEYQIVDPKPEMDDAALADELLPDFFRLSHETRRQCPPHDPDRACHAEALSKAERPRRYVAAAMWNPQILAGSSANPKQLGSGGGGSGTDAGGGRRL